MIRENCPDLSGSGLPRKEFVVRRRIQRSLEWEKAPSQDASRPQAHPLLRLQRQAGNKTVTSLIRPAHDAAKEREADQVADSVLAGLGGTGMAKDLGVAAMAPALRGALAGRAHNLEKVRYDTSAGGAQQAEDMGARAFADGNRVAFAPGELDLTTPEGVHLAAHESAHAALHPPATSAGGQRLVHAKLRGLRGAAQETGGGKTTKGVRKFFKAARTNWDRILDGLGAYEALEDKLTAGGPPSRSVLAKARTAMLSALAKIDSALLAWQKANQHDFEEERAETHRRGAIAMETDVMETTEDFRSKAARRQAVAMLIPRVRTEMADIGKGDWSKTLGLSEESLVAVGHKDSGQMNEVTAVSYRTEDGVSMEGFFKPETGFVPGAKTAGRDVESGIRTMDPNFGARSMAMYRLDQLLQAGVTARVEFAVHEGEFGTVTEKAQGTQAKNVNWTTGPSGEGAVSVDDPTYRRCMNKLQILDAIALQLDRHMGNYFVQTGERGEVTGVTGIDLDMAFGSEFTDLGQEKRSWSAYAYRGMPTEIDEEFGNKILTIREEDVRQALTGLLSAKEVDSTVARFTFVQGKVKEAQKHGQLRKDWGRDNLESTSSSQLEGFMRGGTKSYTEVARAQAVDSDVVQAIKAARRQIRRELGEVPPRTARVFEEILTANPNEGFFSSRGVFYHKIAEMIAGRIITVDQADQIAEDAVTILFEEHGAEFDRIQVKVQEGSLESDSQIASERIAFAQNIEAALKAAANRFVK